MGPQWETPGSHKLGYASKQSHEGSTDNFSSRQVAQADVEKTMAILRDNLKKIHIQLN